MFGELEQFPHIWLGPQRHFCHRRACLGSSFVILQSRIPSEGMPRGDGRAIAEAGFVALQHKNQRIA